MIQAVTLRRRLVSSYRCLERCINSRASVPTFELPMSEHSGRPTKVNFGISSCVLGASPLGLYSTFVRSFLPRQQCEHQPPRVRYRSRSVPHNGTTSHFFSSHLALNAPATSISADLDFVSLLFLFPWNQVLQCQTQRSRTKDNRNNAVIYFRAREGYGRSETGE